MIDANMQDPYDGFGHRNIRVVDGRPTKIPKRAPAFAGAKQSPADHKISLPPDIDSSKPGRQTNALAQYSRVCNFAGGANVYSEMYDDLQPYSCVFVSRESPHPPGHAYERASEIAGVAWLNEQLRRLPFDARYTDPQLCDMSGVDGVGKSRRYVKATRWDRWEANLEQNHPQATNALKAARLLGAWSFDGVLQTSELDDARRKALGSSNMIFNVGIRGPSQVRNGSDGIAIEPLVSPYRPDQFLHQFDPEVRVRDDLLICLHLLPTQSEPGDDEQFYYEYRCWSSRRLWRAHKDLKRKFLDNPDIEGMATIVGAWRVGSVIDSKAAVAPSQWGAFCKRSIQVYAAVDGRWMGRFELLERYGPKVGEMHGGLDYLYAVKCYEGWRNARQKAYSDIYYGLLEQAFWGRPLPPFDQTDPASPEWDELEARLFADLNQWLRDISLNLCSALRQENPMIQSLVQECLNLLTKIDYARDRGKESLRGMREVFRLGSERDPSRPISERELSARFEATVPSCDQATIEEWTDSMFYLSEDYRKLRGKMEQVVNMFKSKELDPQLTPSEIDSARRDLESASEMLTNVSRAADRSWAGFERSIPYKKTFSTELLDEKERLQKLLASIRARCDLMLDAGRKVTECSRRDEVDKHITAARELRKQLDKDVEELRRGTLRLGTEMKQYQPPEKRRPSFDLLDSDEKIGAHAVQASSPRTTAAVPMAVDGAGAEAPASPPIGTAIDVDMPPPPPPPKAPRVVRSRPGTVKPKAATKSSASSTDGSSDDGGAPPPSPPPRTSTPQRRQRRMAASPPRDGSASPDQGGRSMRSQL